MDTNWLKTDGGWLKKEFLRGWGNLGSMLYWTALSVMTGIVVGLVGVGFHHAIEFAQEARQAHGWLLFCLPLTGAAIAAVYQIGGMAHDRGTNLTLLAARGDAEMPLRVAPLVIFATFLTHLTGGSSGREGAALQLGSAIAGHIGRTLRLDEPHTRILILCGMAAGFSALFGTPIASAVFAVEVISVGLVQEAALAPCLVSALTARQVALRLGGETTVFALVGVPVTTWLTLAQVLALGALCGGLAWIEAVALRGAHRLYNKHIHNHCIRTAVGGLLVVLLTLLLGTRDYNGAGMSIIVQAVMGDAHPWAFLFKLVLTALTLGAGFKGGEIVPTFFIGATFGCTAGTLLGLPAGFSAALCMVGLFCGVTNTPLASILLAYELFNGRALPLFALVCAVSWRLSGDGGLYRVQEMAFSKTSLSPHLEEGPAEEDPDGETE